MFSLVLLALALQQTGASPPAPPPPPPAPVAGADRSDDGAQADEPPVLQGFEKRSGKRFSGDFDDAEVTDALRRIADAADWSIVLPPGKHGTISAHFKGVPVEDALRAVLEQSGLAAARDGAMVTVRERSAFQGLPGLGRDLGREVQRALERAQREAGKAGHEVERQVRRSERGVRGGSGRADKVVHGDVVVRMGQPVGDVVAIRGSIKVEPGAQVHDAVAVLGSVLLESGAQAHEVVAVGGDVKLDAGARVERDAVSVGGSIDRQELAEIGGDELSVGVPALTGLATLAGSRLLFDHSGSPVLVVGQVLAKFVVYFALGLLVLALFPRRVEAVAASFTTHPWKALLTGLLGLVALPILIVLLVATLIGIPLVPVAALLVVAAGALGFTALAFHVGRALPLRPERGGVLPLALGTAVVVLVTSIPLLGWMVWVAAVLLTFGAVLRSRFGGPVAILPTTVVPPRNERS